ncbi:DUF945 family protein [Kordiimonas marina]|uniref:DUF945 family protein n=1 Tax=Kordiimonas marina TaxID=2872312 RepID=UPI001FF11B4E|nr:DUF945 family protein [Kordiimonas marina]MCJ9429118.1 YdgA family protein [Kordiimonas marina]
MKKLTLIGGALAIVAGVQIVGAKIIGNSMETQARTIAGAYSDVMGYPFEIKNFTSGWFSSDMTVSVPINKAVLPGLANIGITPEAKDGKAPTIDFDIHLTHGPIILNNGLHFSLAYAAMETGRHASKKAELVVHEQDPDKHETLILFVADLIRAIGPDLMMNVHYDRSVDMSAYFHGGKVALRQQAEGGKSATSLLLKLRPVKSTFHLDSTAKHLTGDTEFGGMTLDLSSPALTTYIQTGSASLKGEYQPLAQGYWAGKANFEMEPMRLTVHEGGKPVLIKLAGLKSESETSTSHAGKEAVLATKATVSSPGLSVMVDDNKLKLGHIEADVRLKNLLLDLVAREMQMRKKLAPEGLSVPFAVVGAKDFASLAERQVEARPELTLDHYTIANADGESSLTGTLRLREDAHANILENPEALAGALQGKFTVKIDTAMLKTLIYEGSSLGPKKPTRAQTDQTADAMLAQYSQAGLIKAEGDSYVSTIQLEDNKLIVNGKPIRPLYAPHQVTKAVPAATPGTDAQQPQ